MGAGETIGDLLDVRRSRLIVIHDEWIGYNPHSPVAAVYDLFRGPRDGFAGHGYFSTGLVEPRVVKIVVSPTAAARFLETIASARVMSGRYEAAQDHTDDYPHLEIALHVGAYEVGRGAGIALLFTKSQGPFNAPWGACLDGHMFTIPGEEIGMALSALRKSLKRGMLDRMMSEADRRGR